MKTNWKTLGLVGSLILEAAFLFTYLWNILVIVGVPLADILWTATGVSGAAFGVFSLRGDGKPAVKVLAFVALAVGVSLIGLLILSTLITKM